MSQAGSSTATAATAGTNHEVVNLDQLVQEITTSTDSKALNVRLHTFGGKDRDRLLSGILTNGQDPLASLDPEQHTLGYLYILSARLSPNPGHHHPSLRVIEDFCLRFKPEEARLAPERVTTLAKNIVHVTSQNLKYALTPLYNLLTRYPPSRSTLTTIHTHFITSCVTVHHYATALPVLSHPITNVDPKLTDLTYNDNLLYHYCGGVAFAALKRWEKAEEFFEICVTAPGTIPAAIQLEALKKLTLVQLILYGKTKPTPKYTNAVLGRLLRASAYGNFVREYPASISKLQTSISKDIETYNTEKNMGLINQVIQRAPRWLIRKLTSTYVTLGLGDIAKEIGSSSEDEVRATIVSMIEAGEINATISVDGNVTFSDLTTTVTKAQIDQALKNAQAQSKLLLELERTLTSSKEYLSKALKQRENDSYAMDDDDGPGGPPSTFNQWGDIL
ncbi:hypothetical protein QCA50_013696 [Cerrena zonata]|uniref:COP9 signalosome complex subunit 3 n=1 Tax=Cerrena zonata TaxID=2478898 RepID=A0AAW0FTZ0_9APHY